MAEETGSQKEGRWVVMMAHSKGGELESMMADLKGGELESTMGGRWEIVMVDS